MDVQTYFFRRSNMNAAGQPRTWTDHLLWHHACHTVDLFQHQTGERPIVANAIQGPIHPQLGIAMDMSIQLKVPSGAILTLSLSFNNAGPFGSFFRYICDNGTYKALYDDLVDGNDKPIDVSKVDVSMNGIELEDREFFAAIAEQREPKSSVAQCLPAMQTLGALEQQLLVVDRCVGGGGARGAAAVGTGCDHVLGGRGGRRAMWPECDVRGHGISFRLSEPRGYASIDLLASPTRRQGRPYQSAWPIAPAEQPSSSHWTTTDLAVKPCGASASALVCIAQCAT